MEEDKEMNKQAAATGHESKGTSTATAPASSSASRTRKSRVVWSDDEEDDERSAAAVAIQDEKSDGSRKNEMSMAAIRRICRVRKDLYENPELNDKLFLNFGGFTEIKNMEHFPHLKSLWLENNQLSSLLPTPSADPSIPTSLGLAPLKSLRCLYLQNNQLTSLEGINVLSESLVLLNVSSNHLTSMAHLASLPHLQVLDIHDNEVEDVRELDAMSQSCPALHTIDLSQNKVTAHPTPTAGALASANSIDESDSASIILPPVFELLSRLPALRVLYLKNNPVVEPVSQYRRLLTAACTKLKFLDDRPINDVDHACAQAWMRGTQEAEAAINATSTAPEHSKDEHAEQPASAASAMRAGRAAEAAIRSASIAEKRAKEERNMIAWRKQKEERAAQLAALAAQQSVSSSYTSPSSDSPAVAPLSSDPQLVKRIYHSRAAPIPASPYHPEIPAVEYSSWIIRQEEVEKEDQEAKEARDAVKAVQQQEEQEKAAAMAATEAAAANAAQSLSSSSSSSSSSSVPASSSSYLTADDNDDPEIVSMKAMLQQVLLSTHGMKGNNLTGAGASTSSSTSKFGVSEAALMDEQEVLAAVAAENQMEKEQAITLEKLNLVSPAARPDAALLTLQDAGEAIDDPASTSASSTSNAASAESAQNDGAAVLGEDDHAPNAYNILQSLTIEQIMQQTIGKLPSVGGITDEDEDDDDDEEEYGSNEEGEEEGAVSSEHSDDFAASVSPDAVVGEANAEESTAAAAAPTSPSPQTPIRSPSTASSTSSPSKSKRRTPRSAQRMPKIFGFGPDDSHLINRPMLRPMMDENEQQQAWGNRDADNEAELQDDGSLHSSSASAAPVTSTFKSPSVSRSSASIGSGTSHRGQTLSDLLEARRAARLGSASKSRTAASPSSAASPTSSSYHLTSRSANSQGSLLDAPADGHAPSSMATGVTAMSLLNQFIQTQSTSPLASASSTAASSSSGWTARTAEEEAAWRMEHEHKQKLFVTAASIGVEHKRREESESEDDDDDDGSSDEDDESVPVDPRAAAAEARRRARQGGMR